MNLKLQINIIGHLLNIWWSVICFFPIMLHWLNFGIDYWLHFSIILSLVIVFLPTQFLRNLQFHNTIKFYENWGAKVFRKFVQEGDYGWLGKKGENRISSILTAKQYLKKIEMYERFHWGCLSFFCLSSIHCFVYNQVKYGLLIIVANMVYNIPTLLLQQYNRLRIETLINRQ